MDNNSKVVKFLSGLVILFAFIASIETFYISYINRELDKAKTEIKQQTATIKYLQKDRLIDETL